MSAPTRLSLRGVAATATGRTGPLPVLSDVTLDVAAGQFVTVVGPSGCGKSTLAQLIAGTAAPAAGRVLADGAPIAVPGPQRALVGRQHALLPWRTVAGNVAFSLEEAGVAAEDRPAAVQRALDLLGLGAMADWTPDELDDADRVRAVLARAIAPQPGVLVLDEPFDALDAVARAALQEDVRRIWRETGVTVVFMTHSADEAIFLGQRVVVLTAGPARVRSVIEVDLGRSRRIPGSVPLRTRIRTSADAEPAASDPTATDRAASSDDLRTARTFAEYRNRVWDELYNAGHLGEGGSADTRRLPVGVC